MGPRFIRLLSRPVAAYDVPAYFLFRVIPWMLNAGRYFPFCLSSAEAVGKSGRR